jgi:iron complex transport system substrate-binding protein
LWGFFVVFFLANPRLVRFVPNLSHSSFRRVLLVSLTVFLLSSGHLAAQTTSSPQTPSAPPTHKVTDGYGRTVSLPVNPSRIISLAPSLTETVYALGVDDRLVGDTDYCDYPPDARNKPKVGGVINPNLEQIVALRPDLVLLAKEGNLLETANALDTLGIPTYATDIHTIDQILTSTQKLADVLNVSDEGRTIAGDLRRRLNALQTKLSGVPPRRVLFIVWPEPPMSVGKNTFIADALRRAGAVSVVDSNQDWPQVSLEEMARLQPDDLIFAPSHADSAGNDFDSLANRPGWDILDAVRNRRYAVVSDGIVRPAPRIVSVIEDLAHQLHPEIFQEKPGMEKQTPPAVTPQAVPPAVPSKPSASLIVSPACDMDSPCAL